MSLLADADASTFWAHHSWPDFADFPNRDQTLVLLPTHGFSHYGGDLPLDLEEVLTSVVVRAAVGAAKEAMSVLVMPPLRFVLGAKKTAFLRIGAELASALLREIAAGVQAAGFRKLVFVNSSAANADLIDAVSRDIRAGLNLQTFIINTAGISLPFSAGSDLASLAAASFLTETTSLDNARARLADSATQLFGLLVEIHARAPLGKSGRAPPIGLRTEIALGRGEPFPEVYRERYLMGFSAARLTTWPAKEKTLIILPTGAIEQHGHHLPVGVDALLGQAALRAALPRLPANLPVLVAPPVTYGKSNEHVGFPGTIYISADSLRKLLLSIAAELHEIGFRRIAIYNTHGGNTAVLNYTLREIEETLGLEITLLRPAYRPPISSQEMHYGFHAGEWETALMLAATPELVKMERATCEYPAQIDDPGQLRPENAPAIFSWISRDLSVSGVMGDATAATLEKGRAWLDGLATSLAEAITVLATR